MNLCRCPICHGRIGLEQLVQDEAGRDLLAEVAKLDNASGAALVSYVGLFRSASRDLSNDRALKLIRETLAIESVQWLTPALQETVESLREKRAQGEVKPLTNHNYLKRVLESVISRGLTHTPAQRPAVGYTSAEATEQRLKDTSWA